MNIDHVGEILHIIWLACVLVILWGLFRPKHL
jgi:hypothetical protein